MKISKRTIAREWLIFLATFALGGGILIFFFAYYDSAGWRGNYDDWFAAILLCFALYVGVILIRSIWWSIKAVNMSKRARYGIIVSIATIVAAGVGAIGIKNAVNRRQDVAKSESTPERRPESTPARTPELPPRVGAADLRKIILSDVTYEKNPFSGPFSFHSLRHSAVINIILSLTSQRGFLQNQDLNPQLRKKFLPGKKRKDTA